MWIIQVLSKLGAGGGGRFGFIDMGKGDKPGRQERAELVRES